MARGGARAGAGRKPNRPTMYVVDGGAPSGDAGGLAAMPSDLPPDQAIVWQKWAPLAIERRTLTVHTVPAFALLCELEAEKRAVKRTLDHDGRTYVKVVIDGAGQEHQELKAHPLTGHYRQVAKQVEGLFQKFMLGPFGKPAGATAKTAVEARKAAVREQFFGGAGRRA